MNWYLNIFNYQFEIILRDGWERRVLKGNLTIKLILLKVVLMFNMLICLYFYGCVHIFSLLWYEVSVYTADICGIIAQSLYSFLNEKHQCKKKIYKKRNKFKNLGFQIKSFNVKFIGVHVYQPIKTICGVECLSVRQQFHNQKHCLEVKMHSRTVNKCLF